MQPILVYSMGTKWRRPHAEKLLSTTLHIPYLAEIWKILCLDPSLLCASFNYCCSSKHNNKALRITFNSCKTVSTSTMVLATVTIDKIIKVTSASSYVYSLSMVHSIAIYGIRRKQYCLLYFFLLTFQWTWGKSGFHSKIVKEKVICEAGNCCLCCLNTECYSSKPKNPRS